VGDLPVKLQKTILLLALSVTSLVGFTYRSQFAHAESTIQASPPWPWPWAIGCSPRWPETDGEWTLPDRSKVSIKLSGIANSSMLVVHVRRVDAAGIIDDGTSRVPARRSWVRVQMYPVNSNAGIPYKLSIHLAYKSDVESCEDERTVMVMSIPAMTQKGETLNIPLNRDSVH
jgi:hypothetical protein